MSHLRDSEATRKGRETTTRDLNNRSTQMSRRGMHPLLMGLDRPERKPAEPSKPSEMSGNESAQRKRFIRSEEQEADEQQAA